MKDALARAGYADEAALAARWAAGVPGPLRLEDGRALRVIFPGTPAGAGGPDFTGAILDAGGDYLRGDIELHLRASGWRAHGHAADPAYAGVVLHVVGENDVQQACTPHGSGRLIPVLVLAAEASGPAPAGFTPPCVLAVANGRLTGPALDRLGLRRLRAKAYRLQPQIAAAGAGQAAYSALLETLAGPANREPFAAIARALPLAALLDAADASLAGRALAMTAELKGQAARLVLRRAGLRPMASPGRRLELAGTLFARLWPAGSRPLFPGALVAGASLAAPPLSRALAIECMVNAVLPVALASGLWTEGAVESAYLALPSPGTYGKLKQLERWLGHGAKPFPGAARLQGGLLLHADYCSRGQCGRCPLSD